MVPDVPPTAEGDLGRTPFAHLVVYTLERKLSGGLFLIEPSGTTHIVQLSKGVPVKIKPGDRYALLGEMLIEKGLIDKEVLDKALAFGGGRLGDMLVMADSVAPDVLEETVEEQFRKRSQRLYSLPNDTLYKYFDGYDAFEASQADAQHIDGFDLIWQGVQAHGEQSALMTECLEKLGEHPLTIHEEARVKRFNMTDKAADVLELLELDPTPLPQLIELGIADEALVKKVVYALLILRQFDFGTSVPVDAASSQPSAVGRVRLVSRRMVAAAPDVAGDGERAAVQPRSRRKGEDGPASGPRSDAAPASDPQEVTSVRSAPKNGPSDPVVEVEDDTPSGVQEVRRRGGTLKSLAELEALSVDELNARAQDRFAERDFDGCVLNCEVSLAKDAEQPDVAALSVHARSLQPGAALKVLAVELDELVRDNEELVSPRYYRGLLRKKLGDDAGAKSDFERVLELDADHSLAKRELAGRRPSVAPPKREESLFAKLFRR